VADVLADIKRIQTEHCRVLATLQAPLDSHQARTVECSMGRALADHALAEHELKTKAPFRACGAVCRFARRRHQGRL
jgi:hypothetical protein